ncbi:cytoplasmic dynein 2 intermediate chain 2 [Brachionichthys hirsutus]|uniref:cytoplasmic dynein 2 intermediate chain 2 n=1 Tax=Brachionichthys hirsutus TaxID=412623 RepID=UPI003604E087
MFSDAAPEPVSVRSLWRECQQSVQESRGCQTTAVHSADAEVQTGSAASSGTQTEPQRLVQQNPEEPEPEPPGLRDFLRRVEDEVVRRLIANARSHAFDGFQVNWEERRNLVSCLHRLRHPGAVERGLHVTSVSWSCTGSVIVSAYGRTDDGDWNTERSHVCLWNLGLRRLDPARADLVIDVPAAVTALCCHPHLPALIAGGLHSGEVMVWDTKRTRDPLLAVTGMSADSHREPVYQVAWVPLQKKGDFGVLSACSGGRVLLWTVDPDHSRLVPSASYTLMRQQVPHSGSGGSKARGSSPVGITALALSPWDSDTFLVGSEGGLLLRCSFSSQTLAEAPPEGQSLTPRAPAVFSFRPSSGPVHSVHCSPFHRNLFVSAGTDGLVHVRTLLQAEPLLSLRVSDAYVFQVQWSPTRPMVFAAATGQGEVHVFDMSRKSLRPAATVEQGAAGRAATCLAFNSQNPHLLAVGKTDGTVGVWQLSSDLTEQHPRESSRLEQIANQGAGETLAEAS